jgi:hypothetical protein
VTNEWKSERKALWAAKNRIHRRAQEAESLLLDLYRYTFDPNRRSTSREPNILTRVRAYLAEVNLLDSADPNKANREDVDAK